MRKFDRKYKNPKRGFDKDDIKARKDIMSKYGLRRRKELLVAQEILRNFRGRARALFAEENEKKKNELLGKLEKMGILGSDAGLDAVLSLKVEDILERRLETVIHRKGKANTPRQARQMIVHGHVSVSQRKVKYPSFFVSKEDENAIEVSGRMEEIVKLEPHGHKSAGHGKAKEGDGS